MNHPVPHTLTRARASLLAVLLAGLVVAPAMAQSRMKNIEQCIESSTEVVPLPAAAAGALTARECAACKSRLLKFDADTRYYIGDEPVSYARLRAAAIKNPTLLYVFYRTGTDTLTRLRLDAGAGAASQ